MSPSPSILVTGATGYVGGKLIPRLLDQGQRLRCMARKPEKLRETFPEGTADSVEIVSADVHRPETLPAALAGINTAYYLIHSLGGGQGFADDDRRGAEHFAAAAKAAAVRRIIYLGGLAHADPEQPQEGLSQHLRSRHETGEELRVSGAQVVEFRASIVIGRGSLSFELIRALVERLPVMICPKWVSTKTQPIAIDDLLAYLVAALDHEVAGNPIYEIGGPECVSYGELMTTYAKMRGLRRWLIRVPVLTPRLSSWWLSLVTPVYARVGRQLIEGLRNPTCVRDPSAREVFAVEPISVEAAIARAMEQH